MDCGWARLLMIWWRLGSWTADSIPNNTTPLPNLLTAIPNTCVIRTRPLSLHVLLGFAQTLLLRSNISADLMVCYALREPIFPCCRRAETREPFGSNADNYAGANRFEISCEGSLGVSCSCKVGDQSIGVAKSRSRRQECCLWASH